ncbi:MAG: hypothetical protein PVI71_05775 [Desulfobacterales bacterium]|jgi:hypothetical protein
MFLQFPQLRSKFLLSDQYDLKADVAAGFKLHRNSLAAQMSVLLSSVVGGVKKLVGIASA